MEQPAERNEPGPGQQLGEPVRRSRRTRPGAGPPVPGRAPARRAAQATPPAGCGSPRSGRARRPRPAGPPSAPRRTAVPDGPVGRGRPCPGKIQPEDVQPQVVRQGCQMSGAAPDVGHPRVPRLPHQLGEDADPGPRERLRLQPVSQHRRVRTVRRPRRRPPWSPPGAPPRERSQQPLHPVPAARPPHGRGTGSGSGTRGGRARFLNPGSPGRV